MKNPSLKSPVTTLTAVALVLAVSLIFGQMSRSSASVKNELNSNNAFAAPAAVAAAQSTGVILPKTNIYLLDTDNTIFVLTPGATSFTRLVRVRQVNGNLIGIDFRPADASGTVLYGLTDTGNLYTIILSA